MKKERKETLINFSISNQDREFIKHLAEKYGTSYSNILRWIIRYLQDGGVIEWNGIKICK
jgi:replication initiation and membrane attachment protein DnaB